MDERIKKAVRAAYQTTQALTELMAAGTILVVGAWREAERDFGPIPIPGEELDSFLGITDNEAKVA